MTRDTRKFASPLSTTISGPGVRAGSAPIRKFARYRSGDVNQADSFTCEQAGCNCISYKSDVQSLAEMSGSITHWLPDNMN
jgi:hypothetical protein